MKLKLNPTRQAVIILLLFVLGAIIKNFSAQIFIHLAATLGFGLILFYILQKITKQSKNISNTIISCLILFLVLHYGLKPTDAFAAMIATFVVLISKFFLEWKGSPIFNPVVLGLFVLEILTLFIPSFQMSFTSWWGVSYSLWPGPITFTLILIAIWIVFCFRSWRKWAVAVTYLLGSLVLTSITEGFSAFLQSIFANSTIYFFTFVMLSEPRTSPMLRKHQIIYGLLAAIISTISMLTGFPTSALLAILIPNFYFFITKWMMMKKMQAAKANTPTSTT